MSIPPIDGGRASRLVSQVIGRRILVVGDVMLDRFIVGDVVRISPEAPVPVVRFHSENERLGGAANVANNLATLGASVSLVGIVGSDRSAGRLRDRLVASGLSAEGLVEDPARPTIEKVRIVTRRNQQVARIDYEEDADASDATERQLIAAIERLGTRVDVVVVSDYLKGAITRAVMRSLVELKAHGTPLLVDPKIPHLDYYAGATLVTPNQQEAETAAHRRIRSDEEARLAAVEFRSRAKCESVLITRGEHGMWLSSVDAEGAIPALAREVADVTGAGDTVIAALALALAAHASLTEAAQLANHAASVVVGKFGPATLTREEWLATVSA